MKNFEFIFAAYIVGWAVFFTYFLSVVGRLRRAEQELRRLKETLESQKPGLTGQP